METLFTLTIGNLHGTNNNINHEINKVFILYIGGIVMNTLLIFFAFPIAVIIFSIILEKLLKNPIAVASLIFAIFIVVTFAAFDETFLIATLAYTILSFITALVVCLLKERRCGDEQEDENCNCNNGTLNTVEDILGTTNCNNNCGCNRYRRR